MHTKVVDWGVGPDTRDPAAAREGKCEDGRRYREATWLTGVGQLEADPFGVVGDHFGALYRERVKAKAAEYGLSCVRSVGGLATWAFPVVHGVQADAGHGHADDERDRDTH